MTIYNMHYIGAGLYSVAQFEAEAKKHGVARALPARIVKTVKWGEPILLAQWVPNREAQTVYKQTFIDSVIAHDDKEIDGETGAIFDPASGKTHYKRIGAANVFGYFNVTGLNMGNVPDEAKQALTSKLNVLRIVNHGPGGTLVSRRCGSYSVGSTTFVADSIDDILTKAAEIEKAHGVKFRWFATGPYTSIDPVTLDPAKFSRGVVKVEVDGDLLVPASGFEPSVSFVYDYERKTYQPKEPEQ